MMRMINHNYDEIINLSRPSSFRHPRQSNEMRAAQFAPFATLTGLDAVAGETARFTENRVELDDDEKQLIALTLNEIAERNEALTAKFTYFVPDERKSGGKYVSMTGEVKRVNTTERVIVMKDGERIEIDSLVAAEILR